MNAKRDFETMYYEQQAQYTEERGILAQERDNALKQLDAWKALAQKITGADANDHGWLRAEVDRSIAKAETERDKLHRRMETMFPLFQEARDALTAIPLASAKLRGIDLSLGDRMDDVGIPERWNAREERKALEAPK